MCDIKFFKKQCVKCEDISLQEIGPFNVENWCKRCDERMCFVNPLTEYQRFELIRVIEGMELFENFDYVSYLLPWFSMTKEMIQACWHSVLPIANIELESFEEPGDVSDHKFCRAAAFFDEHYQYAMTDEEHEDEISRTIDGLEYAHND